MRVELGIRAAVAVVCVVGAVASFIAYRSEQRVEDSVLTVVDGRSSEALDTLDRAGTLNPDIRRYTGKAHFLASRGDGAGAERSMREAARREPENALVWLEWTRMRILLGRPAAARVTYARARELDSQLPPNPPARAG